jgi:hypothetical protein
LDTHQDHLVGRLAEQAQVVQQSRYSQLVRVPCIDLLWTGAAKIHADGSARRQAGIHGVDDQQFLAPANLGQQIGSNGAAIDEVGHGSDMRVFSQPTQCMDTRSVIGEQQVSDAENHNILWRMGITQSARAAG